MSDRVVATFRERRLDDFSTFPHVAGPEIGPNETTATCAVCGYHGIVPDDSRITNAAHPATSDVLVCDVCDSTDGCDVQDNRDVPEAR